MHLFLCSPHTFCTSKWFNSYSISLGVSVYYKEKPKSLRFFLKEIHESTKTMTPFYILMYISRYRKSHIGLSLASIPFSFHLCLVSPFHGCLNEGWEFLLIFLKYYIHKCFDSGVLCVAIEGFTLTSSLSLNVFFFERERES